MAVLKNKGTVSRKDRKVEERQQILASDIALLMQIYPGAGDCEVPPITPKVKEGLIDTIASAITKAGAEKEFLAFVTAWNLNKTAKTPGKLLIESKDNPVFKSRPLKSIETAMPMVAPPDAALS